jgi:hypothetical protein
VFLDKPKPHGFRPAKNWVALNQCDWFYYCGNFLSVKPPIWIIRQESFEKDMKKFLDLSFPEIDKSNIKTNFDDTKGHKNDYSGIPQLSPKAVGNLSRWYAQDILFYEMCNAWIKDSEQFG